MFASKARACPSEATSGAPLLGRLLSSPTKSRLKGGGVFLPKFASTNFKWSISDIRRVSKPVQDVPRRRRRRRRQLRRLQRLRKRRNCRRRRTKKSQRRTVGRSNRRPMLKLSLNYLLVFSSETGDEIKEKSRHMQSDTVLGVIETVKWFRPVRADS